MVILPGNRPDSPQPFSIVQALGRSGLNTHFDRIGFCNTAALISCVDLIVTVDTSVAHLAAAMGKPTWILLPFASDWRWGMLREDSLWYPNVRLFRQPYLGNWRPVFERLRAGIKRRFG
jgi:hypothetical protein